MSVGSERVSGVEGEVSYRRDCTPCAKTCIMAIGVIIALGCVLAGIFVSSGIVRSLEDLLSRKWRMGIGVAAAVIGVGVFVVCWIFNRILSVKKREDLKKELELDRDVREELEIFSEQKNEEGSLKKVALISNIKKWAGALKEEASSVVAVKKNSLEESVNSNICGPEQAIKKIDDKIEELSQMDLSDDERISLNEYLKEIKTQIERILRSS